MLDNKNTYIEELVQLGWKSEEAKIYLELLKGRKTHLELARTTGINRTKVYRVAEELIKKSLIAISTDEDGTFLVGKDPQTLELAVLEQEKEIKNKRAVFEKLVPDLNAIVEQKPKDSLEVLTYDGTEGLKHMLWHELKTEGEALVLGYGALEDITGSRKWSEKHRERTMEAGYKVRELMNPGSKSPKFTDHDKFYENYSSKIIPKNILAIDEHQMMIYNDTVAWYFIKGVRKVGVEVVNKQYAQMMRQVFENYWNNTK